MSVVQRSAISAVIAEAEEQFVQSLPLTVALNVGSDDVSLGDGALRGLVQEEIMGCIHGDQALERGKCYHYYLWGYIFLEL